MAQFLATTEPLSPCKCCGAMAKIFGVLDLVQNVGPTKMDKCGVPIYYHRCDACGYLFTLAFDQFTHEDFARLIYNETYGQLDLGYDFSRAKDNAHLIAENFPGTKNLKVLDYGGGTGKLAAYLRQAGFTSVETYDPFVAEFSTKPTTKYDLVTCFEVVEHTTTPAEPFHVMADFLGPGGMVLFSTQLQPPDVIQQGMNWWYLNPRTGHVSTHTRQSIGLLIQPLDLNFTSFNDLYHALWRGEVPSFASHLVRKAKA
jgi:SAM-dependent methyltransferase